MYRVEKADTAQDGKVAVETFQRSLTKRREGCGCLEPYLLVFMDSQMPLMHGFTAAKKIQELIAAAKRPAGETKVVGISGIVTPEEIEKGK